MRGHAVLLAALLAALAYAKPLNLPQTIRCSGDVYVYRNETTADRSPYVFVELRSAGLHDCINKCFGNQFCYSASYDESRKDSCSLYYFAAYNCTGQTLIPASQIQYTGGTVTLDCLRCPTNGDFVTAPPFSSLSEQKITATGDDGSKLVEKPLVADITKNIDSKLNQKSTTASAPTVTVDLHVDNTTPSSPSPTTNQPEEECNGSLKFIAKTDIDYDTVDLLINETTVESAVACARLCFQMQCGFAFFAPVTQICKYTVDTEKLVDREFCDEDLEELVNSFNLTQPVQMTCHRCIQNEASEKSSPHQQAQDEAEQSGITTTQATTASACYINFQVEEVSPDTNYEYYTVKKVKSANGCARLCFVGLCTTAVYSPSTGECRLGKDRRERCSEAASVFVYTGTSDVRLQCFRCSKKGNTETLATTTSLAFQEEENVTKALIDTTPPPKPSEESATASTNDGNTSTTTTKAETKSNADVPGNMPQPQVATKVEVQDVNGVKTTLRKNCVIKFQARPLSERPAHLKATFELDVPVDSIELCATRCYQDGCVGARFEPKKLLCTLSYDDPSYCARGNVFLHYEATEPTWIHCVNCYALKPSDSTSSNTQATETTTAHSLRNKTVSEKTQQPSETTSTEIARTKTTTTDVDNSFVQKGCLIKFQARPFIERPAQFSAKFELDLRVDSAEICATRCYQDGCSGAKYDPTSLTCSLSYNDKQYCAPGDVFLRYETKEVTWIHCVNCYSMRALAKNASSMPTKTQTTLEPAERMNKSGDLRKNSSDFLSAPFLLPSKHRSSSNTQDDDTSLLKGCVVNFQSIPLDERPVDNTAPFELNLITNTAEVCAHRCYQDGCTAAKYDPKSQQCSLSYEDKPFCSRGKLISTATPTSPVLIHCLSCVPIDNKIVSSESNDGSNARLDTTDGSEEQKSKSTETAESPEERNITEASGEEPSPKIVVVEQTSSSASPVVESTTGSIVANGSGIEASDSTTAGSEATSTAKTLTADLSLDDKPTTQNPEESTITEASGEEPSSKIVVVEQTSSSASPVVESTTGSTVAEGSGIEASDSTTAGSEATSTVKTLTADLSLDDKPTTQNPEESTITEASGEEPSSKIVVVEQTSSSASPVVESTTGSIVADGSGIEASDSTTAGSEATSTAKTLTADLSLDDKPTTQNPEESTITEASGEEPSSKIVVVEQTSSSASPVVESTTGSIVADGSGIEASDSTTAGSEATSTVKTLTADLSLDDKPTTQNPEDSTITEASGEDPSSKIVVVEQTSSSASPVVESTTGSIVADGSGIEASDSTTAGSEATSTVKTLTADLSLDDKPTTQNPEESTITEASGEEPSSKIVVVEQTSSSASPVVESTTGSTVAEGSGIEASDSTTAGSEATSTAKTLTADLSLDDKPTTQNPEESTITEASGEEPSSKILLNQRLDLPLRKEVASKLLILLQQDLKPRQQ
ncbi:unnamed protein product [Caenorhabditis auriculariae]|uniref:Apple domain-containing protein n=1 Tax=Caenorhabditis auriculariae TaxID=2777116 RepID=A0A8S1HBM3_9PELO|nr:unnamed protein product [Caenorhabditis auriculariae]